MWSEGGYDNAGGFYEQNEQNGSQTPGGGEKKRQRANNIVPVGVQTVLGCGEEGLKVEGIEVGTLVVCGEIKSVDDAETKTTFHVDDGSGQVECVLWKDESGNKDKDPDSVITQGTNVRVIGSVRSQQDKRYIMVFRVTSVMSEEELDAHKIEIEHSKLLIKRMNDKENAAIGGNFGLSNSMVGSAPSGNSFGNAKQDSVYRMVAACEREEGIGRDELLSALKSKMSKTELDEALEFLSNEGHVYSTTDEDHFKTTDS